MDAWLQRNRGYLTLALVEAIIFGAFFLWRLPRPAPIEILDPTPRPTATPALIAVYVTGAVLRPDVYTLPERSRLKDALLAAGGARADADLEALNLALALQDGQRVHVPGQGESAPTSAPGSSPAGSQPGGLLNVNTASAAELEALPGIGPALAQRIVEDREANGPYATLEEVARVRGIGAATLEKLRPYICVR